MGELIVKLNPHVHAELLSTKYTETTHLDVLKRILPVLPQLIDGRDIRVGIEKVDWYARWQKLEKIDAQNWLKSVFLRNKARPVSARMMKNVSGRRKKSDYVTTYYYLLLIFHPRFRRQQIRKLASTWPEPLVRRLLKGQCLDVRLIQLSRHRDPTQRVPRSVELLFEICGLGRGKFKLRQPNSGGQ